MPRAAATPATPEPTPDPLAALREQFTGTADEPSALPTGLVEPVPVTLPAAPIAEPLDLAALAATLVDTWHADTTALGFLHKGGRCGCPYMARIGLAALVPTVTVSDEPDAGTD